MEGVDAWTGEWSRVPACPSDEFSPQRCECQVPARAIRRMPNQEAESTQQFCARVWFRYILQLINHMQLTPRI